MSAHSEVKGVTVTRLRRMKADGEKIACLTAYDASFAALVDAAGADLVLVGDSLGMVIQGHQTTVPVTVEDMIYHTRLVARGCRRALLAADMPFMSYSSTEQALHNAARLMREAGARMVKLEGGADQAETVRRLSRQGIPVCAHLGLQPQLIHKLGGYRVQGRGQRAIKAMLEDALILQTAGADLLILECVPASLAAEITAEMDIPVIGIGAGPACDGQILVLYDILGVSLDRSPQFTKNFLMGADGIQTAIQHYVRAVKDQTFPAPEHSFSDSP